jgi:hypothetical protein
MKKSYLFLILAVVMAFASCKKDEEEDTKTTTPTVNIGTISNVNYGYASNGILLSWDAYTDAVSYKVLVDNVYKTTSPITTTSYTVDNLAEGAAIKIEAFSDASAEKLIASHTFNFSAANAGLPVPNAITDLQATEVASKYAKLSWTNPSTEFDGIEIFNGERTSSSSPLAIINANDSNNVTIEALTPETAYNLYVYTINKDGDNKSYSSASNIEFTTPKHIADIEITEYGYNGQYSGSIYLSVKIHGFDLFENESDWTDTGDLILEIYSAETADGEFVLSNTDNYIYPSFVYDKIVQLRSYKDDMNYVDGQNYFLQVIAKDKDGNILGQTAVQEVEFEGEDTSEDIIPGTPTGLELTLNGDCVDMTWNSATNAVSYKVYVSTSSSMSYKELVTTTSSLSAQDCGRGHNVKMYYQVKAVSSTGNIKSGTPVSIWL